MTGQPQYQLAVSTKVFETFDWREHIPLLERLGIHQLELSTDCFHIWQDEQEFTELAERLADSQVQVNSIHAPYQLDPSEFLGSQRTQPMDLSHPDLLQRTTSAKAVSLCLHRLQQLHGRCLVVHPSHHSIPPDQHPWRLQLTADTLTKIAAPLAPDSSQKIALENLCPSFLCADSNEMLQLLDILGDGRFGVCLDLNHCLIQPPTEMAAALGEHLLSLHISDYDGLQERHWMPGRGIIDWPKWFTALQQVNYPGPLLYEVYARLNWPEETPDSEEILQAVVDNARQLFNVASGD